MSIKRGLTLGIRGITPFYSSERYGAHMSRALGAIARRVDGERGRVPVSGTQVRSDPFQYREYLHPLVYRDLITNIVFLGAPCTGKTTIASRLAGEFETEWMPEYGRDYWDRHQVNRRLSPINSSSMPKATSRVKSGFWSVRIDFCSPTRTPSPR